MSTSDREKKRAHLTTAAREFVRSVAPHLDKKSLSLLEDFIENREFAVAVEWLYSIIKERSIVLTPEQEAQLRGLATSVDVDLNSVV